MSGGFPFGLFRPTIANLTPAASKPPWGLRPAAQSTQAKEYGEIISAKRYAESKSVMYAQASFSPSAFRISPLSIRFVPDGATAALPQRTYVAVARYVFDLAELA